MKGFCFFFIFVTGLNRPNTGNGDAVCWLSSNFYKQESEKNPAILPGLCCHLSYRKNSQFCLDPEYLIFRISMVGYFLSQIELHYKKHNDSKEINKVNTNTKITHSLKRCILMCAKGKEWRYFRANLMSIKWVMLSSLHEHLKTIEIPNSSRLLQRHGGFPQIGT